MSASTTHARTPAVDSIDALTPTASCYAAVRAQTERLCEGLATEDYVIQSMPDASPTRWHLAHTSWFFETLVLARVNPSRRAAHPAFATLFNSYYHTIGGQWPRPQRGLLSRPTVEEVYAYRRLIDAEMRALFKRGDVNGEIRDVIEIGLHHEQQHQELILADIKHALSLNPLGPAIRAAQQPGRGPTPPLRWLPYKGGCVEIGADDAGFAYDNERPRHETLLPPFQIADRLMTNAEYLAFIEDGGYRRPALWLSDGWATVQAEGWEAPLYWRRQDDAWQAYTLGGWQPLDLYAPVCHLSYYEADAFARWREARLPTEAEWELAAASVDICGNFVESERWEPAALSGAAVDEKPRQMFGDAWEWTASPYMAYPGYRPPTGPLGEYNAKFMVNQMVLRGGSCVSPRTHLRRTYRNFFAPGARWQFAGVRLAI